jgi:hypothetical protein
MTSNNYCLVKKNKIYEELYDLLEDKELIMDNPNNTKNIKYEIKMLVKSYFDKKIKLSNIFDTSEQTLEDLMVEITGNLEDESLQGNTLLMFANSNFMYEVVFMEQLGFNKSDDELNQFASITNIELAPIYGNVAIIKTGYSNGILKQSLIMEDDMIDLITNNFYHKGVLMNQDGSLLELEFIGDNPNNVIGGQFKMLSPLSLFGLNLVCYVEEGNQENELASKLYGTNIKGRLYVGILCPITNKRFWSLSIDLLNNLIKLIDFSTGTPEQKNKINELENELNDDKLKNPFFLVKKYCV